MAADTLRQLADTAEREKRPVGGPMPSIAGKPDETGITPEMRAALARQRGEA